MLPDLCLFQSSYSQQLQYSLCFSLYQGFINTYDSLHSSQVKLIYLTHWSVLINLLTEM